MKTVPANIYNHKYFKRYIDQSITDPKYISKKNQEILNYLILNPAKKIVDFGCGAGVLSILMAKSFNSKIIGLDYSMSAIKICKENLKKASKEKLKNIPIFTLATISQVPKQKNIDLIILADVIEHLTDKEIVKIFTIFKSWGKECKILIHTDNNFYLKTIGRLLYYLNFIIYPASRKKLLQQKHEDEIMHINLTTPKELRQKLYSLGYEQNELFFPKVTKNAIKIQLGIFSKVPFLVNFCLFLLKKMTLKNFFYPSFYAVYSLPKS